MIATLLLTTTILLRVEAPAPAATAAAAEPASPVTTTRESAPEKALRFEVTVPASVDEVWTALATTEGLETWLWRDARVELRPGGDWLALLPEGKTAGGSVLSFVPRRELVLHAMAPEWFPTVRKERTTAAFTLEAVSPSSTRLTLRQTGWKQGKEWDDAYDYLAKGNAQLLTQLYERFVRGPAKWPAAEHQPAGAAH